MGARTITKFPVYYRPRPYQAEAHNIWRTKKYGVLVWPRQSGKDVAAIMEQCEARLRTPKTTGVYIGLNNPMIRDVIWDKTYLDPETGEYVQTLQDNVPASEVTWRNTVMEGRFRNKSRLKLQGYFQSGTETSGVGTSYQDYTITEHALFTREDPIPRLTPILDNEHENKRLMVASTPRGRRNNPLWKLIESMDGNDDFQLMIRTIDDLNEQMVQHGLPPVRTEEQLERTKDMYLKRFGNSRMFEQEYYVSFDEMDAAAVYGEAYSKLLEDNRCVDFNLDGGHPVYVAFDIGASGIHSDATSWIAFQWFNNRLFLYDCGEGHGKALPEYVDELQTKHWFPKLAHIILPWDGDHHEKAVNATPADMMRQRFPNVAVLAKSNKVWQIPNSRSGDYSLITDIQQTRLQLYNTIIHKTNTEWLQECLEQYKYEFNNKLQEWTNRPLHDKYSHMMDALRYVVQATKEVDFFQGFYDTHSSSSGAYQEDWAGVW